MNGKYKNGRPMDAAFSHGYGIDHMSYYLKRKVSTWGYCNGSSVVVDGGRGFKETLYFQYW